MDFKYKGPQMEYEKIMKDNIYQVLVQFFFIIKNWFAFIYSFNDKKNVKRKASTVESIETSGINTIFANLMQVKTKTK